MALTDKQWAKIHAQTIPSFMHVITGRQVAAGQRIGFEILGVPAGEIHALYMNSEIWAKVVEPALKRYDKERKIKTKLVSP